MQGYDHKKIEKKWQAFWEKNKIYTTPDTAPGKDNFYLLVEFPYPSGNLHVGHWYAFALPDILARYQRMQGKNVMYPIGFDAFGLPAENAAIKNKLNPRKWTEQNIAYMTKQIRSMGTSFDWSREVSTIDPEYYKWTQWMFLQFFNKGLVYQKETAVNWCPKDKTVLANEQVVNGACERCGTEVVQKMMLQWNIKITDYADRLIDDLEKLNWPEQIKESQKNWIGRSEGAEIDFGLDVGGKKYKYVYLHGYTSGADRPRNHWYRVALEALGHTVVIPDLPNTNSPVEKEQVEAALESAEFDEDTVLVGHSLGAVVAMKALLKSEKNIAGLVLIAPAAPPGVLGMGERPFHKTFKWDFDFEKIKTQTKYCTILSDLQETERAPYLRDLAMKLDARLVETNAVKRHFEGDKEPDVLMWLRPTIRVFTTRPDTLFGATYLVLAPEHPWVGLALGHKTVLKNNSEVEKYVGQAKKKTDLERQTDQKDKTGVRLDGVEAINPATGEKIPLYVADYVLGHYGTGAIMAVPAHDERDYEFAKKFNLPIKQVVAPVLRATSGGDAVRAEEGWKERDAIMGIIKHWEKDEYLCIQWKDHEMRTFPSGGIEPGEKADAAAVREVEEETGYKNIEITKQLGGFDYIEFYHQIKKTNVRARFRYFLGKLRDGEQGSVATEESSMHEVVWKRRDELADFLMLKEKDRILNLLAEKEEPAYTGEGIVVDSGAYDGLRSDEARQKMTEAFGRKKTTYKLRDWIVSRQRYWGVPIPIIHCPTCGAQPVLDKDLPVELPEVKDYLPEGSGKSPLAKVKKFVDVKCPKCKGKAERETDTLDTFVDSSWYFLRYTDPKNKKKFADAKKMDHWMPVDLYSGGAEHTTMHLLYSRFWHKALFDLGFVKDAEPYTRRMNRSLILGPDGQKMSKSKGNVVDPDEVVERLGADVVRMYLAFIGPYNEVSSYPWNPDGVVGIRRFLERVWRAREYVQKDETPKLDSVLHKTIRKIGDDIEVLKFNTAISALMIFLNQIEEEKKISHSVWRAFLLMLSPFAPYLSEELWNRSGHHLSIHKETWPEYDPKHLEDALIKVVVQINGKTRGVIVIPLGANKEAITAAAHDAVAPRLLGKKIGRTVVVPRRLVNFVLED